MLELFGLIKKIYTFAASNDKSVLYISRYQR